MTQETLTQAARRTLSILLLELPAAWAALGDRETAEGLPAWISICNRGERLELSERGARCRWNPPSTLRLNRMVRWMGGRILHRALEDWPIVLSDDPPELSAAPDVSFVIPHGGQERIPLLVNTVRSIAAQTEVSFECIVVEQGVEPAAKDHLPDWVRYVHLRPPRPDFPFCKSWLVNVGTREAKGEAIVIHDGDVLAPAAYASEVLGRVRDGADFLDLKRFLFHLPPRTTIGRNGGGKIRIDQAPMAAIQNLHGASVAARRESLIQIGGLDESYRGWGGEDDEMWDRASTMRIDEFGYLPMIHQWHPFQAEKKGDLMTAAGVQRWLEDRKTAPEERIARLGSRDWGNPERISVE